MKSVFMFQINGGMKKGSGLLSQNCFELGSNEGFCLWCIKSFVLVCLII